MKAFLMYAMVLVMFIGPAIPVSGQEPSDDPFGGGFPIDYDAEIFTMGTQNDSLHGWGYNWDSISSTIVLKGDGSFPESYQCGDKRDIAVADFNGDFMDELVMAWNRADSGVFIGIPTIDTIQLDPDPDPARWHLPDDPIPAGVLYATDTLADLLGEVRVVAGNFYADRAMEFVLAYLAANSTVTLSVFDVDTMTLKPVKKATISDQAVNTEVEPTQLAGKICRFDVTTGDFDGDGLDEIVLVANDPAHSPATDVMVDVYDYDTLGRAIVPVFDTSFTANDNPEHTCLRRLMVTAGNFDTDSRDEVAFVDLWASTPVEVGRVGNLHIVKLNPGMTAIETTQSDILAPVPHVSATGLDSMRTSPAMRLLSGCWAAIPTTTPVRAPPISSRSSETVSRPRPDTATTA